MVVVVEQDVSPEWQVQISDWIVESGCLFMMAWGKDCSTWDGSVDWANIDCFEDGNIPDEKFVMTTSHANEPLYEAFWFCRFLAFHPNLELPSAYIVHITDVPREEELIGLFWTDSDEEWCNPVTL
jgi:hypothetical protein